MRRRRVRSLVCVISAAPETHGMSAFYIVQAFFCYFPAAAQLLPACSLSLPLLPFPLLRFFASRKFFLSLCKLDDAHRYGPQSRPSHPALFCMRFENDRFPSAPGAGHSEPRPLSPALSLPSRAFCLLSACALSHRSDADSGLRDIGLRGRLALSCSPSQADPNLIFQFLSRVRATWTCCPTGLSCGRLIDRASEPVWRSRPEHLLFVSSLSSSRLLLLRPFSRASLACLRSH